MNNSDTPHAALITGANSGIGQAAATELARRGWRVFAAARSTERGRAAVTQIQNDSGSAAVELLELDLASFSSVRSATAELLERAPRLDALVNNAGVNLGRRTLTEDGLESTMQVNHFGHVLLTSLLLSRLMQSDDPRVVNVSSMLYQRAGAMPLDDLQLEHQWRGFRPYCISKLANILFTKALHRRYFEHGLATFAVHPGGVRTRLGADGDRGGPLSILWRLVQPFLLSAENGAAPIVDLVDDADKRQLAGAYFNRHQAATLNEHANDHHAAERLWDASNELTDAQWPTL